MASRGQSAQRLRALRKKYGLGEFAKSRTGRRTRSSARDKRQLRKLAKAEKRMNKVLDKREARQRIRKRPVFGPGGYKPPPGFGITKASPQGTKFFLKHLSPYKLGTGSTL